jgi:uncharacterized protein YndB with AHSA1/START domain
MITIDEDAPVIVRPSAEIDAPIATLWELHTDIAAWATWNTDVEQAGLDGPLMPGSSYSRRTHGLDTTSTVRELVPGEHIVWGGPAGGIDGITHGRSSSATASRRPHQEVLRRAGRGDAR